MGRLFRPNSPHDDFGPEVILAAHRSSRHTTQHRDLPDVSQGIGYGSLKQPLGRGAEGCVRGQIGIELLEHTPQ